MKRTSNDREGNGVFTSDDLARIQNAIDAVCFELSVTDRGHRDKIAGGILRTYRQGDRMPLNLVSAGLEAAG